MRRNAGKRYMAEYLTELSKLIANNKFNILNLEELILYQKVSWIIMKSSCLKRIIGNVEIHYLLKKKYLKVLSQRFN